MPADLKPVPKKDESLIKKTVSLPQAVWDGIEELRQATGRIDFSRQFEECLLVGIDEVRARVTKAVGLENAQLVNRKLKARQAHIVDAVARLAGRYADDPDVGILSEKLRD